MMSSNEIKNKTFQSAFRGYDREEVDSFLATLADEMKKLEASNEALNLRLAKVETELAAKVASEDAIHRALVDSQTAAAQVIENAKQKGEELEALTREACGKVLKEFRENSNSLHRISMCFQQFFRLLHQVFLGFLSLHLYLQYLGYF